MNDVTFLLANIFGIVDESDLDKINNYVMHDKKLDAWINQATSQDKDWIISICKDIIYKTDMPNYDKHIVTTTIKCHTDRIAIAQLDCICDEYFSMKKICTARDLEGINKAVDKGYTPLIKQVIPLDDITVTYALDRDRNTGKLIEQTDPSTIWEHQEGLERVIDATDYYPYDFESPYAAYLVPSDIKIGERVLLIDVIEDYKCETWHMNKYRLRSAEAIWNGVDFEIDFKSVNCNHLKERKVLYE